METCVAGPSCGCSHGCGHEHGTNRGKETLGALILFAIGMVSRGTGHGPWMVLLLAAYLAAGWRVLLSAGHNILDGRLFDENFLMSIASLGAIAIGEIPEAVGVMVLFSLGELLQDKAVERSRGAIQALLAIRPDYARVDRGGDWREVSPEEVVPGERILVRPGERVPLDGRVIEGETLMDTSALTGESMPRSLGVGEKALAGMVNTRGVVVIEVEHPYSESSVARILRLVEEAGERKAHTERFITTFSRYYTPAVVALAAALAILPPLLVPGQVFSDWVHRALVLLVISCPCALVISIPLGYFAGIGGASRRGILVKGANYLEALAKVDTVVFDKTGTLTHGAFRVVEIEPEEDFSEDEVLRLAVHAGAYSDHPVSLSIREAYQGGPIDHDAITESEELRGMGMRALVRGERVLAGNDRLLHHENIEHDVCATDGTVVNVAKGGVLTGRIRLADQVKEEASVAIKRLQRVGVKKTVMLTGDVDHVASQVADEVGIDEFQANLLPEEKVRALEMVMERSGKVAFAGDGINDAPALIRADVGIAMGGLGSDAAIEAADVVIMDDNPARIADAIEIAKRTRRIVLQNIIFALGVKALVLMLGSIGAATMWSAVFADVGVALIAVLNSTRAYGRWGSLKAKSRALPA
ncbi:MAG: cadmium-translocating P-type ATPase [Firmicutes bacterium]|nr:cadmium-translocating P-type ATPase [Bacillota bacterium]